MPLIVPGFFIVSFSIDFKESRRGSVGSGADQIPLDLKGTFSVKHRVGFILLRRILEGNLVCLLNCQRLVLVFVIIMYYQNDPR